VYKEGNMKRQGYVEQDMVEIRTHVDAASYEIRHFVRERNAQIEAMIQKTFDEYISRGEFAKEIVEQIREEMSREITSTVGLMVDQTVRRWMQDKGEERVRKISEQLWGEYYGVKGAK
jgi:dTDP-4-dehydrorhamnose reductase